MNKALLLSIQPQHLYNILIGKKTLELRKSVPKGFKGWIYLYCTMAKPRLFRLMDKPHWCLENNIPNGWILDKLDKGFNGKVVARFWFDEYDTIKGNFEPDYFGEVDGELYIGNLYDLEPMLDTEQIAKLACIGEIEMLDYFENVNAKKPDYVVGYAWHIKQLEVFDTPMALSEFYKSNNGTDYLAYILEEVKDDKYMAKQYEEAIETYKLTKAPQSYQYVYVKENAHD